MEGHYGISPETTQRRVTDLNIYELQGTGVSVKQSLKRYLSHIY